MIRIRFWIHKKQIIKKQERMKEVHLDSCFLFYNSIKFQFNLPLCYPLINYHVFLY